MVAEARTGQFSLDIGLPVRASFGTFVGRGNEEVLHVLEHVAESPAEQVVYLWGAPGVGRSHLLQAVCQRASDQGRPFLYLPMRELLSYPPESVADVDGAYLIALDDVDAVSGRTDWQEALFHLYNRVMAAGGSVVCVAGQTPQNLELGLNDLRSRLASGVVLQVRELDDDGLRLALRDRAERVGMHLPDAVIEYLCKRIGRNMPVVVETIEKIDRLSLAEQSRPTVPLVKRALQGEAK